MKFAIDNRGYFPCFGVYMRFLYLILILTACTGRLSDKLDNQRFLCGEGYEEEKSYIKVSDEVELISFPKNAKVTNKGCIERPVEGQILVTNLDRSLGIWLNSSSKNEVNLEPLNPSSLPSACSSVVHGDGRGFSLNLDLSKKSSSRDLQKISVKLLSSSSGSEIAFWPARDLSETISFQFDNQKPVLAGEYLLQAEISDVVSGSSSMSECTLRVDYSELLISPAESVKSKRIYNGQEVLLVQPGYNVNFYVHEGFRDVSIEYCLRPISIAQVSQAMDPALFKCDSVQDFLKTKSSVLNQGYWLLNYRGKRGAVQGGWQHAVFFVDTVCSGTFVSPEELRGRNCTTIRGRVEVGKNFTDSDLGLLDSISMVYGDVSVENTIVNAELFKNLQEIYGHLSVNSTLSNADIFPVLASIWGDLAIEFNDESDNYQGFQSLKKVSGALNIQSLNDDNENASWPMLQFVEGDVTIGETNRKSLNFLPKLEYCRSFSMNKNSSIENLDGLVSIKRIDSLLLTNMDKLTSIKTYGTLEIGSFVVQNIPKLKRFTYQDAKILVLKTFESYSLLSLEMLNGLYLSEKIDTFLINNSPIESLEGVVGGEEFQLIQFENMWRLKSLKGLEKLATIGNFLIYGCPLSSLSDLRSLKELNKLSLQGRALDDGFHMDLSALSQVENPVILEIENVVGLSFVNLDKDITLSLSIRNGGMKDLDFLSEKIHLNSLKVHDSELVSLRGLNLVQEVAGDLEFRGLLDLESIDALSNFKIGGNFYFGSSRYDPWAVASGEFDGDTKIKDFSPLSQISEVRGQVVIRTKSCIPPTFLSELSSKVKGEAVPSKEFQLRPAEPVPDLGKFFVKMPEECATGT